jgi:O-antigen ligase
MSSLAYAALWMFVFAVPWEAVVVVPGLAVVSRLTGVLALGLTLFSVVVTARFRRWQLLHVAALLFLAWAGAGVWIFSMVQVPNKFYTFAQLFTVLWMVWELAPSRQRVLGLFTAYVLGAYIEALGTLMLFRTHGAALKRFALAGADPNTLAMRLSLAIPMAWYVGMTTQRPLLRLVCRAYVPVGVLGVALTGSRGGMIACFLSLLVVPLTMTLSPKRLAMAVVMLILSGTLAVVYVPDKVVDRLATTGSSMESGSFGGRVRLWIAGVHAFEQRPVMGYGVASFKQAIAPEVGSNTQVAHNSFLSVLVEEGMVGLALYLLMFLSVYLAIIRLPGHDRWFALVLLGTLFTAMLPLTWEDQKSVWFVLAALFAFSQVGLATPVAPIRPVSRGVGPRRGRLGIPRGAGRMAPLDARVNRDVTG